MAVHSGKGRGPGHLNRSPQGLGSGAVTPILYSHTETFGRMCNSGTGAAQTDLAQTLANPRWGGYMPAGTQEWELQNAATVGGTLTNFVYNSGANNPLTRTGYTGTSNTGRTPYRAATITGSQYSWEYRCRVNGGPWSNWATLTYNIDATGASWGNNYSGDGFSTAVLSAASDVWYAAGGRTIYLMSGISRTRYGMGASPLGFTFTLTSDRVKIMWANNQRPPIISGMSVGAGADGVWVDLEYDGVTVTEGRIVGFAASETGKFKFSSARNCRFTRINAMNTEADYLAEYTVVSGGNNWAFLDIGNSDPAYPNEVGILGDDSYANYVNHVFFGVTFTGEIIIANNVFWNSHGRHIGAGIAVTGSLRQDNILGGLFRSSNDGTGIHTDKDWAADGAGGIVQQAPKHINQLITSTPEAIMAGRLIVLGSTGTTMAVGDPEVRGCLVADAYIFGSELFRWSGRARMSWNDYSMLPVGDYTVYAEGGPYDVGNAGMTMNAQPASALPVGATMECDGNVVYNYLNFNATATAAVEPGGTNVEGLRGSNSAWLNGYVNGRPDTYLIANPPLGDWRMPRTAAEMLAFRQAYWTAFRRNDGLGPVNDAGTGWRTLPA